MAITAFYDTDDLNYIQVINNEASLIETRLRATLRDMIAALDAIKERLDDRDIAFFGIDPSGTWNEDEGIFEASSEASMRYWADVANRPELLRDAKAWLVAVETFLESSDHGCVEGIWEDDITQLGELGAAVLAITHVELVQHSPS